MDINLLILQKAEENRKKKNEIAKKMRERSGDELKEKQKEVQKFCKSIKNKTITVDEETGESFEFFPPAKSSTTSIKKTIL